METDSEDGTLGYAGSRDVIGHLDGTVTWLPKKGAVVRSGGTLYKVNGRAVFLMSGTQPAYRKLSSSASGAGRDVLQLERNLRALGYDPSHAMSVDGTWGSATTAAVKRWQSSQGLNQNGSIALGRVVFQPGARRVAALNVTLGGSASSSGGSGGSAGGATNGGVAYRSSGGARVSTIAYRGGEAETATIAAAGTTTTPSTTTTTPTTTTPAPTTTTPAPTTTSPSPTTTTPSTSTQQSQTPSSGQSSAGGANGSAGSGASGASSSSSTPSAKIMTTTSTQKVVTVALDTTKSSIAKRGARVSVQLPSSRTVTGRISGVGKVATKQSSSSGNGSSSSSTSSSSTATISLTIGLSSRGTAIDQAPVTVRFEQSRVKNVLAIPVTALLARPGGKFAVEVVENGTRRLVTVTPGVYTSGNVEINGTGLQAGMRVTNAAVQ